MRENLFLAAVVLGILLIFLLLSWIVKQHRLKKIRRRMQYYYGKWRETSYSDEVLSVIKAYSSKKETMIDDITWNDLNLDGVFQKLNHTWSFAGEDYLYYLLRVPTSEQMDWDKQERLIAWYQEHEKERSEMQMIFAGIGKYHGASIYEYIRSSIARNTSVPPIHYLCLFALIGSIAAAFAEPTTGVGMLIFCIMANIGLYFYKRKSLEGAMQALQYFLKLQNGAGQILKKKLLPESEYMTGMKNDYDQLKKKLGRTSMLKPPDWDSQSPAELVLDYVRLITHMDCILFYRCMRRLHEDIDVVENLITRMGFLESMLVIGSLRKALPYYCIPEFTENELNGALEIQDAYHPLIEEPVANSISASRGVLITGSNASGKSTFLKTVAVNVILAQGLHTCAAHQYKGQWFHVMSSMALRDNLYQGESYYIAEIKALKRVLDAKPPVLCFVDEVLRGTNTVERIAASSQVLKAFTKKQILCFAATHDIELTYLLEEFYENYHFQEQVVDGEIVFDYCLYEGRSNSRNAIRLLENLGYEKEIISGAEQMVSGFLESGKWEM